jgi:hypothetical protein
MPCAALAHIGQVIFQHGDHEDSPARFCSKRHWSITYATGSRTTMATTTLYRRPIIGHDATTGGLSITKDMLRSRFKHVYCHLSWPMNSEDERHHLEQEQTYPQILGVIPAKTPITLTYPPTRQSIDKALLGTS